MNLQLTILISILTSLFFLLIVIFIVDFKKLKTSENYKLNILKNAILQEKNITSSLKNKSQKIDILQKKTNQQLLTIRIKVFNLEFSLSKIFS
ncbi:hypothetical protein BTO18_10755 [Polaribacter porphyrae]|uniref:Uncharacterized protein n=1 Tax=Polaribacter porphyrae TaxID=1137780 RepID=A0A2S7WQN5_9FLAO|nr:hypothetical protein BTO18_10755 [Polaribacter porphyrae]